MLYLLLNLDIFSLTVGILRSPCVVSLVTYQGASIKEKMETYLASNGALCLRPYL